MSTWIEIILLVDLSTDQPYHPLKDISLEMPIPTLLKNNSNKKMQPLIWIGYLALRSCKQNTCFIRWLGKSKEHSNEFKRKIYKFIQLIQHWPRLTIICWLCDCNKTHSRSILWCTQFQFTNFWCCFSLYGSSFWTLEDKYFKSICHLYSIRVSLIPCTFIQDKNRV